MRKYFIAGAVALMVFAIVAFAASLSVDGGVLQTGQDRDLTSAADEAQIFYRTSNSGHTKTNWVKEIHVVFDEPPVPVGYKEDRGTVDCELTIWGEGTTQLGQAIIPLEGGEEALVFDVNSGELNPEDVLVVDVMLVTSWNNNLSDPLIGSWGMGVLSGMGE